MPGVRSVTLGIFFRVGSRDEQNDEAGLSHFLEHMMFKGTAQRDALQISESFDALGALPNAFTSKETTCYYATMLDESLPGVMEILGDMVTSPLFAPDACASEGQVIIEEIARGEDDPEDQSHELFAKTLWPRHPLGLPIGGTRASVASFGQPQARAYHRRHYRPDSCYVIAAGNVDHAGLVALAQKHLQRLKSGGVSTPIPADLRRVAPRAYKRSALTSKETEQAHVLYGTTTMPAGDKRRFALSLLNTAFGGTMSSRLFQEVREKRGLAYAVYSMPALYEGRGMFAVYVGTRPDNGAKVLEVVRREFDKLGAARGGLKAAELDRARAVAKGALAVALESTSKRMLRLSDALLLGQAALSAEESLERLDAVSLGEVRELGGQLAASAKTLTVVGPYERLDWKLS
jgi:predicted Zn-dependent peptidase